MALGNSHIVWTPGTTLEQIERQAIELAHAFYRNNKSSASRSLGISVKTLETKLKKYANDDREQRRVDHDLDEDRKRLLAAQRGDVYKPIPYVEPEEIEAAEVVEADEPERKAEQNEDSLARKIKDLPPVIPAGGQLSAKVVGAR